ncbi:hypothetical protein OC861_005784 [Tilletia horrida]|nr:hypothetical protein OC845_002201 [Tilletia horrida]KAK0561506.1 hypothetical protein OC861_005784 [Tilletia horrida]
MANPIISLLSSVLYLLKFLIATLTGVFASSTNSSKHLTAHVHTGRIVVYRGPSTYIPVSVLSDRTTSNLDDVQITLIQRGWIAGLFGWTVAKFLGNISDRGIDVTPESTKPWDSSSSAGQQASTQEQEEVSTSLSAPTLSSKQRLTIHKELDKLIASSDIPHKNKLSTLQIRIPVHSGDGYFRIKIKAKNNVVYTPTFRILSISLHSASIKGSSILPPTIVPELFIRTLSVAATTALWGLFPIAALLEKVLPAKWSRKMLGWLYKKLGMEKRQQDFMDKHGQKVVQAKRKTMETIPFASLGVRTDLELEKDAKVGRGGVAYVH